MPLPHVPCLASWSAWAETDFIQHHRQQQHGPESGCLSACPDSRHDPRRLHAVIARTANCRDSSVRRIRTNMRCYGSTKAPPNGVGRRRLLSPPMLTVDRLAVKPNMYRDEMVEFLEKEFETTIPASNISRSLRSAR
ncbi:hypothetical protein LZL87_014317 [Fusarium oxysporum]|nr:hypothetical protein LZL87_014317 [Fusarium oxysporum]